MQVTDAMRSMIQAMDGHIHIPDHEKLDMLFSGTYRFYVAHWVWVHHGEARTQILSQLIEKNRETWDKSTYRKAIELRKFLTIIYRLEFSTRVPIYLFSLKKPSGQLISYFLRESGNHLVLGYEEVHDILIGANHAIEIKFNLGRDDLNEWLATYFYKLDQPLKFCCAGLLSGEDWKTIQQVIDSNHK